MPAIGGHPSSSWRLAVLVAAVIIAPLLVIDTPLLADFPNHLARMHIIGNVNSDLFLSERYSIRFGALPNIAMDLVVPWLAAAMPLHLAARFFLACCLLAPVLSAAFLHRTLFNRWSCQPMLAALFAYHASFLAGMANFSLGVGLVPAALAIWIRIGNQGQVLRVLIGSLLALALYFCHLVAFGAYGLLLIGYTFWQVRGERRLPRRGLRMLAPWAIAGATGLLPLALFSTLPAASGGAPAVVFGNLAWKLKALLVPLANYHLPLDLASFALVAGLALLALRLGWLEIDRRMRPGLLLLATALLLAPKAIGSGGVLDQRFAVLLAPMLIACTRFTAPRPAIARGLFALLALLFLLRMGVVAHTWVAHRADLAEMRQAIALIERGGRLLVVRPEIDTGLRLAPPRHRVFHHAAQLASLPALAVLEKSAFVSTLYALPGQQPLVLKPPFDRLGGQGDVDLPTLGHLKQALTADSLGDADPRIRSWLEDFDYVLLLYGYGPGAVDRAQELPLRPLLDGASVDLFAIVRNRGTTPRRPPAAARAHPHIRGAEPSPPWRRSSPAGAASAPARSRP
jgi:hypothetical protein